MRALPPLVVAALGCTTLPTGAALSTALRGLPTPARLALWTWAHAVASSRAAGPPTRHQWAAVLGAPLATLDSLRRRCDELAALEVARLTRGRPPTADPSDGALRSRASRESAKAARTIAEWKSAAKKRRRLKTAAAKKRRLRKTAAA